MRTLVFVVGGVSAVFNAGMFGALVFATFRVTELASVSAFGAAVFALALVHAVVAIVSARRRSRRALIGVLAAVSGWVLISLGVASVGAKLLTPHEWVYWFGVGLAFSAPTLLTGLAAGALAVRCAATRAVAAA